MKKEKIARKGIKLASVTPPEEPKVRRSPEYVGLPSGELESAVNLYHRHYEKNKLWEKTKWLGQPMWKLPSDAIIVQEIIFETQPSLIIETGTGMGGSALFYATVLHLMGSGEVITIDVDRKFHNFGNSQAACRVNFIEGSSLDPKVVDLVFRRSTGRRCMVVLDSWHSYDHVTEELKTYWGLVSPGCYLIVEDTHVSGHPVEWEWGKGPYEAVDEFIIDHKDKFDRDLSRERHLMTFNPNGFLRRKS